MIRRRILTLVLSASLMAPCADAPAFETDQYDLPPTPLADIGDEVTQHVDEKIRDAIDKLNADIANRSHCRVAQQETGKGNGEPASTNTCAKLSYLQSEDAVVHEVYKALGAGTPPFTSMGTWMD